MDPVTVVAVRLEGAGEYIYAAFDLSHDPSAEWIRHFETCLVEHSTVPVEVAGGCVRAEVPEGVSLRAARELVERCAEKANFAERQS